MTRTRLFVVAFALGAAAVLVWGLLTARPDPISASSDDFSAGRCGAEAVLLISDHTVLDAPGGNEITSLADGSPIYLCELQDGHRRVVFPQPGSSADCSGRSEDFCPSGYIKTPFETLILG